MGRWDSSGIGFVEVMIAVAILIIVLAMLVPRLSAQRRYFDADVREFVDSLQVTRQLAISRGLHYRLRSVTASTYAIEQGLDGGGSWTFPTTIRSVTLHPRVQFGGGVGQAAEFNTRGEMVGLTFSLVNGRLLQGYWRMQEVYGYSPPPRRWFYDVDFNDADNLPPLSPRFVTLRQRFFAEEFR